MKIKKLLIAIFLFVLLFASWFVYAIVTDKPPQFFPLDNPEGEYRISRKCPSGQGWNKNFEAESYVYCVEYEGPNVFAGGENDRPNFFRITVGKSKVNLAEFVGKNITSIDGEFARSSNQCILDSCVKIGGPFVVLDIVSLEI